MTRRALAAWPRSELVVSTKVGRILVPGPARPGDEAFYADTDLVRVRDYSRDGVLRSLESSLGRLGRDRAGDPGDAPHFRIVHMVERLPRTR